MLYDGDAAGIKAALRGTDMILEEGMNVRVVILPDQEDPDSFVRRMGSTEFSKYIKDNRKDLILFKASLFAEEAKSDPIKKAELIRDIVQSIGKVPDPIQRSIYTQQCADRFGMQEQILISEVNKIRRARAKEEHKEDIAPQIEAQDMAANAVVHREQLKPEVQTQEYIERDIVTALMEYGTWEIQIGEEQTETATKFILEDMEGITFQSQYKYVYDYIKAEYEEGRIHEPNHYTMNTDPEISGPAIKLLTDDSYDDLSPGWWTKYEVVVPDKTRTFNKNIISATMRLKQLKNLETLKKVEDMMREEKDEEKILKLMKQHKALMDQKKDFAKATGTVIYRPL
jgi:DNA primase